MKMKTETELEARAGKRKWSLLFTLPIVLFATGFAHAGGVAALTQHGPDPSTAIYTESATDMTVRVAGVDWRVDRLYTDGWVILPDWQQLDFTRDLTRYGDYNRKIFRGRFVYEIQTNPSPLIEGNPVVWIDSNDPAKRIEKTVDGYRWRDLDGNWIEYDAQGYAERVGDRYGHRLTLVYEADARQLQRVEDPTGRTVLTFTSHTNGKPATITDYSGRQVRYTWDNDRLSAVTDVRGKTWRYENHAYYTHLLGKKTDPLERDTHIAYLTIAGGNYMICSGGGGGISQTIDPDTGQITYTDSGGDGNLVCMMMQIPEQVRLKSITNADGRTTKYTFRYDGKDETYWIGNVDPDGNFTESQYAAKTGAQLQSFVNGQPGPRELQSDDLDVQIDVEGNSTAYHKNAKGQVVKIVHPDGASETFQYHPVFDELTVERDARGTVTRSEWTPEGRITQRILAQGTAAEQIIDYTTNALGLPLTVTYRGDANTAQATYTYTYDADGNLTGITEPLSADGIVRTTRWAEFDAMGNARKMIDARGNTWLYDYDPAGNLTNLTTPEGHATTFSYNHAGELTAVQLPGIEGQLSYTYDAQSRITAVTDPEGHTLSLAYSGAGQIKSVTDPAGHAHQFSYLDASRLSQLTDPANHQIGFSYRNAEDKPTAQPRDITTPAFVEQRTYDARQRLTTSVLVDPAGLIGDLETHYQYDANGNVTRITDPAGRITTYTYDALDRLTDIKDPASGTTHYQWDDRDNLIAVTDPDFSTTRYVYDAADRLIEEHRPEGQVWRYSYDANGNLAALIRPDQGAVAYDYDKDNRLVRERRYDHETDYLADTAGTQAPEAVTYTWHPAGWLTGYTGPNSSATYVYDNSGRLTAETTDFGAFEKTQAYTWTADGLKATVTNPEGITYTYGWTALHQPDAVTIPGHGSIASLGYDWQASNGWMYPGGTQHKQEHDAFLRLAKQRLTDPAQVVKQGADYQYDAASNITAITKHERSAQTEGELAQSPATYGYDALDRLTSVSKTTTTNTTRTENYQYDAVGNRINSTGTDTVDGSYTHNANHALTNLDVSAGEGGDEIEQDPGTWTFQYNANGAITQKAFTPTGATAATKTWTYGWNRQNRLSTVHYNGTHIASYAYDPFGRRTKKTVHSSITGGTTGTTYYLYNDTGLVAEYTQTGQLNTEYHYVPGSHWSTNPLFARDGETNEIYYAATDQLGTATALIKSSGQVVWKAEKTAFGKTTTTAENNNAGNPVQFNLRFPGQYEDTETGLHYNWMRYYDAEIGRYTNEDPIGLAGGLNPYRYALNNPQRFFDPTGEIIPAIPGLYVRCILSCMAGAAIGGALDAMMGCDSAFDGAASGCALGCLNPLNWLGGGKAPKPKLGKGPKTYQTYTKKNPKTGETYSGRTSGNGDPLDNIARRDRNHHMNDKGFGPAQLDKSSPNRDAIRGREQQLIDRHGGAQSMGGTSGNPINGVSPRNPNRDRYREAAEREFGGG